MTLFRQRFNQSIRNAFSATGLSTRKEHYAKFVKRFRYKLADMTEEGLALLHSLHRYAIVMALPLEKVLAADGQILAGLRDDGAFQWAETAGISYMYENPAVGEAMRVLYLRSTADMSIPVRSKAELEVKADDTAEPGIRKNADLEPLRAGSVQRVQTEATANRSADDIIDLTMED